MVSSDVSGFEKTTNTNLMIALGSKIEDRKYLLSVTPHD